MTEQLMQLKRDNNTVPIGRVKKIGNSISRLAIASTVTFGIGTFSLIERYNNYWDKTIFRVQTVDFNILAHTLPAKLSYTIINNQPEELQRTLDSNYSLFGLIVTDPSGQKIIAASGGKDNNKQSWAAALNPQELQNYPYDVLLNPPPLFPQWSYKDSHDTESTATNFTNQGRIIGRVYYVRGVRPTFQDDFLKWLSDPLSASSRIELYTATMVGCIGGGIAFWSLWEYLLYKKQVQKEEAEREAKRKEEELIREAEQKEQELIREAEIKDQQAKQKEELLLQQNETLDLQLQERVNQLNSLQEQYKNERLDSINQAEELRERNQQLEQEISQLRKTMQLLPTVVNSQSTQAELDRTKKEAELTRQSQQQQEEEIKQLNYQLQNYQNQLNEVKQKSAEFKKLQQQIEEIKLARSQAESEMEKLRNSEYRFRETVTSLEERLLKEQSVQEQLNKQLDILQRSLIESQQQEQESRLKAEKVSEQLELLAEEAERITDGMVRRDLNRFERKILNVLETSLTEKILYSHFDAGQGNSNSKFIDFIVLLDNCAIAIEAKSYKGVISPLGDSRNTNWLCLTGAKNRKFPINSCWGVNPYQQVNTYVNSLLGRLNSHSQIQKHKPAVFGIVVFPSGSEISPSITDNIGGFYRVTTLDKLLETINLLAAEVQAQNKISISYIKIDQMLTAVSEQLAA